MRTEQTKDNTCQGAQVKTEDQARGVETSVSGDSMNRGPQAGRHKRNKARK